MTQEARSAATTESRLRAGRDYYRRRWIMHGISWRGFGAWPKNALAALARARTEDA
jgi:hypothetical protein